MEDGDLTGQTAMKLLVNSWRMASTDDSLSVIAEAAGGEGGGTGHLVSLSILCALRNPGVASKTPTRAET